VFIFNQTKNVQKKQQKARSTVNFARSSSISFFWRFNKAASVIICSIDKEEKLILKHTLQCKAEPDHTSYEKKCNQTTI